MPQIPAGAIKVNWGRLSIAEKRSIFAYRIRPAELYEHVIGRRGASWSRHGVVTPRFLR
jgi:hypothetical protein